MKYKPWDLYFYHYSLEKRVRGLEGSTPGDGTARPCEVLPPDCCARPPAIDDHNCIAFGQPVAYATCTTGLKTGFVLGALALEQAESNCCDQNFFAPMDLNEMPNPTNNPADE